MPGSIKRVTLTSDQLIDLRARLKDVIDEAQRLRDQVARALIDSRGRGKRPSIVPLPGARGRKSVVSRARRTH